jgi:myo-inositol 2-dehydrogenase/D-chiro-inositol 1-dehydrogenase
VKGIGVIGTGNIGTAHVRLLSSRVSGARVAALFDVDAGRAKALAADVGCVAHASAQEVIDDPSVEAVLVAAPGERHAALSLACITEGKPVLCEKPLAPTTDECLEVINAEVAHQGRLVQVGFMRRFDPGYLSLKRAIDDGDIGEVLLVHCVHRNGSVPPSFTADMALTDSVVHEIDVTRWLLGEEIVACSVQPVRRSPLAADGLQDPQLVILESASGVIVEVESFVNCQYGYDVRCEVVGSTGVASLGAPGAVTVCRSGSRREAVPDDWRSRFGDAYHDELQAWVDAFHAGTTLGPSAWDGYAATAVAGACVRSLGTGTRETVTLVGRPDIYASP